MTEDWEQSHLPLQDPRVVLPPHFVLCDNCKGALPKRSNARACYQIGSQLFEFDYCNQVCKDNHRITLIRESGL